MSKEPVKLSIIVPIYNVEEYLTACLESIDRSILHISAEVLLIDDGSLDGSSEIAKSFSDHHDKFLYFRKENGGLSSARNYGAERASGKYICFVDSDDVVTERMYENMLAAAEFHDADLTIVNVARMDSKKIGRSSLHMRVFNDNERNVTHIRECDNLIYDTTAWNKLIKRSFWKDNDFKYPVGWRFEDMPVSLAMHCKANKVALVREVGYLWRIRDGKSLSITQEKNSLVNLEHRLKMLGDMFTYIADQQDNDARLIDLLKKKVLSIDIILYIDQMAKMEDYHLQEEFYNRISAFLNKYIGQWNYETLSLLSNQKYDFFFSFEMSKLKQLYSFGEKTYSSVELRDDAQGIITELPDSLFTISRRCVANDYALQDPWQRTINASLSENKLSLFSSCLIKRLDLPESTDETIEIILCNSLTEATLRLPVHRIKCNYETRAQGTVYDRRTGKECSYNYDGACYEFKMDLASFDVRPFYGDNYIIVKYSNKLRQGSYLYSVSNQRLRSYLDNSIITESDHYAKIRFDVKDNLFIEIGQINDNHIDFDAMSDLLNSDTPVAVHGNYRIIHLGSSESIAKEGCLTLDSLPFGEYFIDAPNGELITNVRHKVSSSANPHCILIPTRNGKLKLIKQDHLCCLYCLCTTDEKKFTVGIEFPASLRQKNTTISLAYCDTKTRELLTIANEDTTSAAEPSKAKFSVNFAETRLRENLYSGNRLLYICFTTNEDIITLPIFAEYFYKESLDTGEEIIDIYSDNDKLNLYISGDTPYTKNQKHFAKKQLYPKYRELPLDEKCILFESYMGKQYSCNPRALYEYINEHHPEYKCVWSLTDPRIPINGRAIRVKKYSPEYYQYLATAKYLVTNLNFEKSYIKRHGQIVIQTMHGMPYKNTGLDVKTDFLIVQGQLSEQNIRQWFGYKGKILRTGYPRTDSLFSYDDNAKAALRKQLGLPIDKQIILYAPASKAGAAVEIPFDLNYMRKNLGHDYILLIRLHQMMTEANSIAEEGCFVFDFGSYDNIEDLYAISDILITDYSSVMFDYALTSKPIIFFIYDLKEHIGESEGAYIDIEKEAPGPVVNTTEDLVRSIVSIGQRLNDNEQEFFDKYLTYENLNSAAQIYNEVFVKNTPGKTERLSLFAKRAIHKLFRTHKSLAATK